MAWAIVSAPHIKLANNELSRGAGSWDELCKLCLCPQSTEEYSDRTMISMQHYHDPTLQVCESPDYILESGRPGDIRLHRDL